MKKLASKTLKPLGLLIACCIALMLMVGTAFPDSYGTSNDTSAEKKVEQVVAAEPSPESSKTADVQASDEVTEEIDSKAEAATTNNAETDEAITKKNSSDTSSKTTANDSSSKKPEAASKAESKSTNDEQKATVEPKKSDEGKAAQSNASSDNAKESEPTEKAADANASKTYCMLSIAGTMVSYIDCHNGPTPNTGAGIWMGSDSTTDGSYGYFIGHNPGSFSCVMNLGMGSSVTVWDSNGDQRTYNVVDIFEVARDSHWSDVSPRVTCYGEAVAMQTCNGDCYRIVVAV